MNRSEFTRWFAGSAIVDSQGRPLVVYHGTRFAFETFGPGRPLSAPLNPVGVYFTADRQVAEEYAQDVDGALDERSRIMAAYLRITNDQEGRIIDRPYTGREFVVFDPASILVLPERSQVFDPATGDLGPMVRDRSFENTPSL